MSSFIRRLVSQRAARMLLVASVAVVGCGDSSTEANSGWDVGDRFDAGDADDLREEDAPGDAQLDTDPGEPRCPSGELPQDGVCDIILMTGAEWGTAFGDEQIGSSWAVATVYIDGRVEVGPEQIFDEEGPVVTANSGPRSYLIAEFGTRVVALDATDDFEQLGDVSLPPFGQPSEDVVPTRNAAYVEERSAGYIVLHKPAATLAMLAESNGRVDESYIDLSESLGDNTNMGTIAADGPGHFLGVMTPDDGPSYAFGFSAAGNFLVEQDDGDELIELPRRAVGPRLVRTPGGHFVVDLDPMNALNEIDGGLFRIESLGAGRYRADDYIITSQQLGGNPHRVVMSAERRGVAVVDGDEGMEAVYFSADGAAPQVHKLDVPRVRGLCASPDKQRVWMATAEGYYAWRASQPRRVEHVSEPLLSYKPKRCAFAR